MNAALKRLMVMGCLFSGGAGAQAQSAFTYQGQLSDAGLPANGSYELYFQLSSDPGGANPVGGPVIMTEHISNGLFTVTLDFGSDAFSNGDRWLGLAVRVAGSPDPMTPLTPLQKITPAPVSHHARSVDWTSIQGMPAGFADGTDDGGGAISLPVAEDFQGQDTSAMTITQTGVGSAGRFIGSDSGNYYELLFSSNAGSGPSLMTVKPNDAMGLAAQVQGLNPFNPFPAMMIRNEANTAALQVDANVNGSGYGISANTWGDGWAGKFSGPDNDGSTAALIVDSGDQRMLIDGNEIDSDDGVHLNYNSSAKVVLGFGGGNVGVGTVEPTARLHVRNETANGAAGMAVNQVGTGRSGLFQISNPTNNAVAVEISTAGSGPGLAVTAGDVIMNEDCAVLGTLDIGYEIVTATEEDSNSVCVSCPSGKRAIGGGCRSSDALRQNDPGAGGNGTGWCCVVDGVLTDADSVTATAICARVE